jgi:hypothetical protein
MINSFELHEMLDRLYRIYRIAEMLTVERVVLNALAIAAFSRLIFETSFSKSTPLEITAPSAILFAIAFRRSRSILVVAGMALVRTIGRKPSDHPASHFVTLREMLRNR